LFGVLDIGAATAKAVILNDNKIISYFVLPTGQSVTMATDKVIHGAIKKGGVNTSGFERVVSTDYGRHFISFADLGEELNGF